MTNIALVLVKIQFAYPVEMFGQY